MSPKKVAVLFGGQSSEHVVSCMSVVNVINHIDRESYDVIIIGITEQGRWLQVESVEEIESGEWRAGTVTAIISPDAVSPSVWFVEDDRLEQITIDLVFPVLHGVNGEDGTVQGLLELSGIPYVGCGVLASAVSMDKLYTKIVVKELGVCQAAYVGVDRSELYDMEQIRQRVENQLDYPVFIKPSNAGSSKGVSKAENYQELVQSLKEAAKYDRKILVEEMVCGREVECAVLTNGNGEIRASGVGEILAAADFYDFEAKYYNAQSKTVINPELPSDVKEKIQKAAVAIFQAVDGYGLSRVDFFAKEDGEIVFNEINTLPGFTAISMYPMLWEAAGLSKKELIKELMESAFIRYREN